MTESLRLLSRPADVAEAFAAAVAWSTTFDFCTPAVDSRLGRWPLWQTMFEGAPKARLAYVAFDGLRSEPHALEELYRWGALRLVPGADGSFRSHIFRFRKDSTCRVIMGSGALVPDGIMAPLEAVVVWEGPELGSFALEAERLFARAKDLAHVPERAELERYAALFFEGAPHREALSTMGAPLIRRTAADGELLDLEVVTEARVIRETMATLKQQLTAVATTAQSQTVGFHGGSATETVYWSAALGMWSLFKKLENRYWNCFGVERPDLTKSLQITVEVNPPLEGLNRRMAGAIARELGSGRRFLVHRGKIGGGQKGIGADLFWGRFRGGVHMREPNRDEPSRVVLVGEVGGPSFVRDVAAFVHEVRRIKAAA